MSKQRVVVGMSGGVDSSVAAWLLKQQGYDVVGLFMNNWEEKSDHGFCTAESDYNDVRDVCARIGIPHYSVSFADEYMDRVFAHFLREYESGRTPNPDVLCNREIKFDAFKKFARQLGATAIATGHYADIESIDGDLWLKRAACADKDQTYFLNQLTQPMLDGVIFPLAQLQKADVRRIATEQGFSVAHKKDSTGICFIGERRFKTFLANYLPAKSGEIRDLEQRVVGRHDGLMYYTLGQRRGLGIGGVKGGAGDRWFVVSKDLKNNVLYVSEGEDERMYSNGCAVHSLNLIPSREAVVKLFGGEQFECTAKLRYRQPDIKVKVTLGKNDTATLDFDTPQRAVTAGQYAVFYRGSYCLGGGCEGIEWR